MATKSEPLWALVVVCAIWAVVSWPAAVLGQDGAGEATPQGAAPEHGPVTAPATVASEYTIQPGDTLQVTVLGMPDCSGSFLVRPEGTILVQNEMLGSVAVAGSTVADAGKLLTSRIGEYVKDPTVILSIARFRVTVVGLVREPGQYEVASGARLSEVVEKAGGATDESRDLNRVYVTKASGSELQFDLRAFKQQGDQSQNPLLEPGDRVSVGKPVTGRSEEFRVTGAVTKPGAYPLGGGVTRISDAVSSAGRWTADANPRAARLIRKDGTTVVVDITQLDSHSGSEQDLELRDGDELLVPRNTAMVNVLGGVRKPGQYYVAPGTSLLEVITTAGGLEEGAILSQCAVIRGQPQAKRIPVDLERLMKQGDMSQNPQVQDRDVVFVPVRAPARAGTRGTFDAIADNIWRYLWVFGVF